jgi:hypothetical protein
MVTPPPCCDPERILSCFVHWLTTTVKEAAVGRTALILALATLSAGLAACSSIPSAPGYRFARPDAYGLDRTTTNSATLRNSMTYPTGPG